MTKLSGDESELPKLRASFRFPNDAHLLRTDDKISEFYDVKFCPYQPLDQDPVFAAVSKKHAAQTAPADVQPCRVLSVVRDATEHACACCCTWSRDPETGTPWLCVAGDDATIKVYNAVTAELLVCLTGHGSEISDVTTNPADPTIIASASGDKTLRLWSLHPKHEDAPCRAILGGAGHQDSVLSVAFHQTGRYLVSGGHDQLICLWAIPDLPQEPMASPTLIHYPHFATMAIHHQIVDCVGFFHDMIISRACDDPNITLWSITGFSSSGPVAPPETAPIPTDLTKLNAKDVKRFTRTAFLTKRSGAAPYTRLLSFHTPGVHTWDGSGEQQAQYYMRFGLHLHPDHHPTLAFCNVLGEVLMWDLQRMVDYQELKDNVEDPESDAATALHVPAWLGKPTSRGTSQPARSRPGSLSREASHSTTGAPDGGGEEDAAKIRGLLESSRKKYCLAHQQSERTKPEGLAAHRKERIGTTLVGRRADWSPGGAWCVVATSSNYILILQRWAPCQS